MHSPNPLPPLPMPAERWAAVVAQLHVSEQTARVAEMVLRGLSDKSIGAELGIGVGTVRIYIARLFLKTGAENRVGLVIKFFVMAAGEDSGEAFRQSR